MPTIEDLISLEEEIDIGGVTVTKIADLTIIEIEGRQNCLDVIYYEFA